MILKLMVNYFMRKFNKIIYFHCFSYILVLIPVNEYKIADKIQSANDQLFSPDEAESEKSDKMKENLEEISIRLDQMKLQSTHKVTFSSDIEEIEDNIEACEIRTESIEEYYDDNDDQINEEINIIFDRKETEQEAQHRLESSPQYNPKKSPNDSITPSSQNEHSPDFNEIIIENHRSERKINSRQTNMSNKRLSDTPRINKIPQKSKKSEADILKIHLNVKKCCETKQMENNYLPRYKGYLSQYGLTKDQLEQRKHKKLMLQQQKRERILQKREQKRRQSEDNEEAFRLWLRRKSNKTQSKTKNMYDINKKHSK